jgi:hypothetical protein
MHKLEASGQLFPEFTAPLFIIDYLGITRIFIESEDFRFRESINEQ